MSGEWIKVRHDLTDDPSVVSMAVALDVEPDTIVGKLVRLWSWADRHTVDGRAAIPASWIDSFLGLVGFADAMAKAGWLVVAEAGFHFANFERHNGRSAKARAGEALRKAQNRAGIYSEGHVRTNVRTNPGQITDNTRTKKKKKKKKKKFGEEERAFGAPRARARRPAPPAPPLDPYQGVDIPTELDTQEFHLAWAAYCRMRRESGMPTLRRAGIRLKLAEWEFYPVAVVVAALEESTLQQWRGVFPRKHVQRPREQRSFWEKSVGERLFEDIQREVKKHAPDRDEDPAASREREPEYETHGRNGPGVVGDAPRLLGRRTLESGEGGGDAAALRRADGGRPDR